jgi:ABC-2 type transport system ATP-binding protein
MIELKHLSKRYGHTLAVDDLTVSVRPGEVTGLLNPNGAGKSTAMRVLVGLERPTSGSATVDGLEFSNSPVPLRTLGALLDAQALHPGRRARAHLLGLAATQSIPDRRVDEVLDMTGLATVGKRRIGAFSLGMRQRLGIAAALLGDPHTLVLDEPVNGLDPDGVHWVRSLVRYLAGEGRTVLLSSHLMSEMALTADHVIVIGRGRLITAAPIDEVVARATHSDVFVRTPTPEPLIEAVRSAGGIAQSDGDGAIVVSGMPIEQVGALAFSAGAVLYELVARHGSLEDAFLALTEDERQFGSASPSASATQAGMSS